MSLPRGFNRDKNKGAVTRYQVNWQIKDREVRVVRDDGEQLGIMSGQQAYQMAKEAGLDLVKISPQASPPVCKIMDYGKFKYDSTKKAKEQKRNQKVVELKEILLSAVIDIGDLQTKARHGNKFLEDGNKVKVSIRLKGRQMAHPEVALRIMKDYCECCKGNCTVEKEASQDGRLITMILAPVKVKGEARKPEAEKPAQEAQKAQPVKPAKPTPATEAKPQAAKPPVKQTPAGEAQKSQPVTPAKAPAGEANKAPAAKPHVKQAPAGEANKPQPVKPVNKPPAQEAQKAQPATPVKAPAGDTNKPQAAKPANKEQQPKKEQPPKPKA